MSEELRSLRESGVAGAWIEDLDRTFAELNADRMRLRTLERRLRAILGYYDAEDLAAHVAAAVDGGPTYDPAGVVRPVWINHKLVDTIRELRRELFPDEPERTS